ncbi:MAG: xanthine dehydrogenase, partial [Acidimicrobiia bacterium]|nr:xanthine dehydrogenase [Acidimicrobiia bacterium]
MVVASLNRLVAEEKLGALATLVEGPEIGAKAVIEHDAGFVAGELPAEIAGDVLADARALMDEEQNRTLQYGERSVFIETVAPPPHLVVFGAVHIAQPLSTMAKQLGFHITISDARGAFTTPERFPDADRVLVG